MLPGESSVASETGITSTFIQLNNTCKAKIRSTGTTVESSLYNSNIIYATAGLQELGIYHIIQETERPQKREPVKDCGHCTGTLPRHSRGPRNPQPAARLRQNQREALDI